MTFPYRANALERDLNLPQGIPNLQVRQVGYALDYEHLDIYGRPKMTYAWNRNVHAKDLATRKPSGNLTPPYTPPAVSKEPLRVLPKPNRTKAYRDAEEFLKAEEDFREKQRFRNQITPARRNGLLTVGTNLSTSGLPVPDKNGNVYSYPAEVTAMTGLVYESPVANEIPQIDHRNVPSQKRQPVILTEEPRLKVDADTGETKLSFGTGTVIPPSILVAESHPLPMPKIFPGIVKSEEDPVLPGSFPNPQRDAKQTTPTMPLPELTDKTEIQNILEAEQAALIEATQPLSGIPAVSPFQFQGNPRFQTTPLSGKRKPPSQTQERATSKKRRVDTQIAGSKRKAESQLQRSIVKNRRIEDEVDDVVLTPYIEPGAPRMHGADR